MNVFLCKAVCSRLCTHRISAEGEKAGIVKIVPPPEWQHPCQVTLQDRFIFPTNRQKVHTLQESDGYTNGKDYNLQVGIHVYMLYSVYAFMCYCFVYAEL